MCKAIVVDSMPQKRRCFCAGGDVKAVLDNPDVEDALRFFKSEYAMNHLISSMRTPVISILDGITSSFF